jgi:hypothetical protein
VVARPPFVVHPGAVVTPPTAPRTRPVPAPAVVPAQAATDATLREIARLDNEIRSAALHGDTATARRLQIQRQQRVGELRQQQHAEQLRQCRAAGTC